MRFIRLAGKRLSLELRRQMTDRVDFVLKTFATLFADSIGPIVALLIYQATPGIPGWSFEEFLLFQGTLMLVFALWKFSSLALPYILFDVLSEGLLDQFLLKPYDALKHLLATSLDPEGIPEVLLALAVVGYASSQLSLVFGWNFVWYIILVAAGVFMQQAAMILVGALSIRFTKSEAILNLWYKFSDFARYPLDVYGSGLRFFLSFGIPVAVSSFYPAEALLGGLQLLQVVKVVSAVAFFYAFCILVWHGSLRRYVSAGG